MKKLSGNVYWRAITCYVGAESRSWMIRARGASVLRVTYHNTGRTAERVAPARPPLRAVNTPPRPSLRPPAPRTPRCTPRARNAFTFYGRYYIMFLPGVVFYPSRRAPHKHFLCFTSAPVRCRHFLWLQLIWEHTYSALSRNCLFFACSYNNDGD